MVYKDPIPFRFHIDPISRWYDVYKDHIPTHPNDPILIPKNDTILIVCKDLIPILYNDAIPLFYKDPILTSIKTLFRSYINIPLGRLLRRNSDGIKRSHSDLIMTPFHSSLLTLFRSTVKIWTVRLLRPKSDDIEISDSELILIPHNDPILIACWDLIPILHNDTFPLVEKIPHVCRL